MPPERVLIRLQNAKNGVDTVAASLSEILDDGVVDEGEAKQLPQLRDELLEVRRRMDEALAVLEKLQNAPSAE